MILTAEELQRIIAHRDGSLSEVPVATLLLALAVEKRSAVLELQRNPLQKQIVFEDGVPVDCLSNIATESLGRFLVSIGKLSEADHHTVLNAATTRDLPFEDILIERQLIAPAELYRLLQQNLGRKLLDVFTWRSGRFHISADVPPVDSPLRVNVEQLLLTGLLKFASHEEVEASEAAARGKHLQLRGKSLIPIDDLRFSAEQQKLLPLLRRGTTLEQLEREAGDAADEVPQLLHALVALGLVEILEAPPQRAPMLELELEVEQSPPIAPPIAPAPVATPAAELPKEKREPQPAPVSAPRPPAASLFGTRTREMRLAGASPDDLMRMYLSFRRKDPLDLLGIPEDATNVTVVQAFLRFADTFFPGRFEDDHDSLREKAEEIFLAGARAYAEVADAERRAEVVARRVGRRQAMKPRTTEVPLPKENLIDPDALHRKGRELAEAGKLREALSYFEMAADCDAQNGTYASELAYCRFELMISPAAFALKSLKNALRIDPRCGVAYLYTGKIHAALGNRLEAEGYLRKAASMLPRDRRPQEALRAMKA